MQYIAQIKWIKPEDGGRINSIPFNTDKYGPQIKFKGSQGNWSLIVNNFKKVDNSTTLAKVHYLNAEKCPNTLYIGMDFELYEGTKKVALGTIVNMLD